MTAITIAPWPAAAPARAAGARRECALAVLAVAALTAYRLWQLPFAPYDLYVDEAQYWYWSQFPAFGYFSKPPAVAWLIAATTWLFGDGHFGVRCGSAVLLGVTALTLFFVGRDLHGPRVGLWAALLFASAPGASISALVVSTDPIMLACWAAGMLAALRALAGRPAWWLGVGAAIGLGTLGRYGMLLFPVSLALFLALAPAARARVDWRWLGGGVALALLLIAPNLAWNAGHGMVSAAHTLDNAGPLAGFSVLKLLEFAAAQFGLLGPLVGGALAVLLLRRATWVEPRALFLAAFVAPMLGLMLAVSILGNAKANWAAAAFVAAPVLVAAACAAGRLWLLRASLAINLLVLGAVHHFDALVRAFDLPVTRRIDPFARLHGWAEIARAAGEVAAANPGTSLAAATRDMYAALVFYVRPHPFDAAAWRPPGARPGHHFDLVAPIDGRSGDFVFVTEWPLPAVIAAGFERVESSRRVCSAPRFGWQRCATITVLRGHRARAPG